jgi:hypothetical protein
MKARTYRRARVANAVLKLLALPTAVLVELLEILDTLTRGTESRVLTLLSLRGQEGKAKAAVRISRCSSIGQRAQLLEEL